MPRPPIVHTIADTVSRRLPKGMSPHGHAAADYAAVSLFALAGALFWKTNRRAAIAAWACGGATLLLSLGTDYPGGIAPAIPFHKHRKVELELAALIATVPDLAGFRRGRWFFLLQSGAMTVNANLTRRT